MQRGQLAGECSCQICQARKNNVVGIKGYGGAKKAPQKIVTEETSMHPKLESNKKPCGKCFQKETGKGIAHPCTLLKRKENLAQLILDEKCGNSEQIVSKLIKKVIEKKGTDQKGNRNMKQMKGGADLRISVGQKKLKDNGLVDAVTTAKIKKRLDLSKRDTKEILNILRKGNVKVEKNVMKIVEEIGSNLEDEYEDVKMEMEYTQKVKNKSKVVVRTKEFNVPIVKDVKRLVKKIIEARGLNPETVKCKPVMDAGQGSLKCTLSVFDNDVDP